MDLTYYEMCLHGFQWNTPQEVKIFKRHKTGLIASCPIFLFFVLKPSVIFSTKLKLQDTNMITLRKKLRSTRFFFANDSLLFCNANSLECSRLLKLFEIYEKRLNKDKTSILLSNNIRKRQRKLLQKLPR